MQDKEARKGLNAAHHLLYLILRGKNWHRAFAPVSNPVKLENGGQYNWGARKALFALHSEGNAQKLLAPFADFVRFLQTATAWDGAAGIAADLRSRRKRCQAIDPAIALSPDCVPNKTGMPRERSRAASPRSNALDRLPSIITGLVVVR